MLGELIILKSTLLLFRRASTVNVSLEKLADAPDASTKPHDRRPESLEEQPPPKPPHTYYNKHRYPDDGEVRATGKETQQTAC